MYFLLLFVDCCCFDLSGFFFRTGFLYVALSGLELAVQTSLAPTHRGLPLPPKLRVKDVWLACAF